MRLPPASACLASSAAAGSSRRSGGRYKRLPFQHHLGDSSTPGPTGVRSSFQHCTGGQRPPAGLRSSPGPRGQRLAPRGLSSRVSTAAVDSSPPASRPATNKAEGLGPPAFPGVGRVGVGMVAASIGGFRVLPGAGTGGLEKGA